MPNTKEDRRNAYKAMIANMRSMRESYNAKMEHAQQNKKVSNDGAVMNDADRLKLKQDASLRKKVSTEGQRKAEVDGEYEQQRKKSQAGKFWDGMND